MLGLQPHSIACSSKEGKGHSLSLSVEVGVGKSHRWRQETATKRLCAAPSQKPGADLDRNRYDHSATQFSLRSSDKHSSAHTLQSHLSLAPLPKTLTAAFADPLAGFLHVQNSLLVLVLSSSPQNHLSAAVPTSAQRSGELFIASLHRQSVWVKSKSKRVL